MSGGKSADPETAVRVLTAVRGVSWPLHRSTLEELFARHGWTRTHDRPSGVFADAGMGLGGDRGARPVQQPSPGDRNRAAGPIDRGPVEDLTGDGGTRAGDIRADRAAAIGVFGDPSSRIVDGRRPEVRWRDDRTTLSLVRSNQVLYGCARSNDWQDLLDQVDAQADRG